MQFLSKKKYYAQLHTFCQKSHLNLFWILLFLFYSFLTFKTERWNLFSIKLLLCFRIYYFWITKSLFIFIHVYMYAYNMCIYMYICLILFLAILINKSRWDHHFWFYVFFLLPSNIFLVKVVSFHTIPMIKSNLSLPFHHQIPKKQYLYNRKYFIKSLSIHLIYL